QQDYGMRIYDPRLGRFLSVDPLTKNFPHYTPYQFAGNNPILNIDLDGAEELNAIKRFLDITIDMAPAPASYKGVSGVTRNTTYNLHGYPVNNLYFWEKLIEKYPSYLDDWNKGRVLVEGRSPVFTNELRTHLSSQGFDVDGLKIGDIIDHHHINQGRTATPVTNTEHKKIPVQKNPEGVKVSSAFGRFFKAAGALAANVGTEITGIFSENPDAAINQLGSMSDLGRVYKNTESGLYYTIVSLQKNERSGTSKFWLYGSYEWNDEQGKFIGTNPVGYGIQYEERGGYIKTDVYDLDGKLKSSNSSGVRQNDGML
ncbi:MAG TPA: RHS repeat-associated core domain-containing protein, partial [Cytophagaceae bacterium]